MKGQRQKERWQVAVYIFVLLDSVGITLGLPYGIGCLVSIICPCFVVCRVVSAFGNCYLSPTICGLLPASAIW